MDTPVIDSPDSPEQLTLTSLERIRQRLVDTSARNRLINCGLDRMQVVRLVDELPDQVFQRLNEGKPFHMRAVPAPSHQELIDEGYVEFDPITNERTKDKYPTAAVWARRHGISTDYDMPPGLDEDPSPNHADDKLQTLLFPKDLSNRLGKISQLTKTASEESGTNILYLALGFLEWYESPSSDTARLSPLFVVPIDLTRGSRMGTDGLRSYQIGLRDDGLLSNVSLAQRMMNDFHLEIPPISDESEPESFFAEIARVIASQDSRWCVRRYASICMLDFTKQLMYEDLDPARWPSDKNISDHPLLQQFFAAGENEQTEANGKTLDEHSIDEIPDIHSDFPLIYEADSSQHSALIDVVKGNNLVIEGPPGTGKSQTITNLIAACINKGLSVLFVAEKLAALEVVKKRLDGAGLGDFCLEVHSHKSSKLNILSSLMDSHKRRESVTSPSELNQQIQRYEAHKETLHHFANKLNKPWGNSGLTPHQILQRATDFSERTPLDSRTSIVTIDDPANISASLISQTLEATERLQVVFDAVSQQTPDASIHKHPWFGLQNGNILGAQRQNLLSALEEWLKSQQSIKGLWQNLQTSLSIDLDDIPNEKALANSLESLQDLPSEIPENLLQRLDELQHNLPALESLEQKRVKFRRNFTDLVNDFNVSHLHNAQQANATCSALRSIRDELGLLGSAPIGKVNDHIEQLQILQERIERFVENRTDLRNALPEEFDDAFITSNSGLNELISLLEVASSLPPELWSRRDDQYNKSGFRPSLDELEPQVVDLRLAHEQLLQTFNVERLPETRTLEDIQHILNSHKHFGFLNKTYREAKNALKGFTRTGVKSAVAQGKLSTLIVYKRDMDSLIHSYRQNPAMGTAFTGLDTNFPLHRKLSDWYQSVDQYFSGSSLRLSPKAIAIFNLDNRAVDVLLRAKNSTLSEDAQSSQDSLKKLTGIYPVFFNAFDHETDFLDSSLGVPGLINKLDICVQEIGDSISDPDRTLSDMLERASHWENCATDHKVWTEDKAYTKFVPSLFNISSRIDVDDQHAVAALSSAQQLSRVSTDSSLFLVAITQEPTLGQLSRLRQCMPELTSEVQKANKAQVLFEEIGSVNTEQWMGDCKTLTQIQRRNVHALEQSDWLDTWSSYQRVKQRTGLETLAGLIYALESGELTSDQTALAVQADIYQQLAEHIMSVDIDLQSFDGNEMQAIRQQFQRYDKELLVLQREQIAARCCQTTVPAGNNKGTVGSYSEYSLIQHEAGKKKKHVAIRSLLKRSPRAIKALKPCFMMSPMSVAQYLEPGQYEFDVIVMDEASQIRPEEALGAIARAKQLVVVGDPKQLPPTSFFSRMAVDGDADDSEEVGLEQSESILDSVLPLFDTRRLRWHYRSRHESLIQFSNQKYYDSDLVLFPSPFNESDEYGINFTRVTDATFQTGVNLVEASRVVDLLAEQLQSRPDESVGVVAMNIKQRDQIEAELERRLADDSQLQKAYASNQKTEEPLFLKNLENVQGDERDVIIISMTYGPEIAGGITYQRFGPINSDVGWRRLNVLLTRSKKRMEIIASMGSGDVVVDSTKKLGVRSLKALLEYCETGHLNSTTHTGKQPDSAFEISVIRKLATAGYESEPQVGVAGFFIDLAVRNPDRPGEFLMGIECDGATYHSAKSARDRDRLRQEVLENLGWNIRRIWSTDWFRNADAQMQPILAELGRLRASSAASQVADKAIQRTFLEEETEETSE